MSEKIVARWHDWSGKSLEHLVLQEDSDEIVAESAIIGSIDDDNFAARYRILCDESWREREGGSEAIANERWIEKSHHVVATTLYACAQPPSVLHRSLS